MLNTNMDEFYKYIQQFIDEQTLVTIGSGISSAEGVPGMGKLAMELIKDVPNLITLTDKEKIDEWQNIKTHLDKGIDLETTLTDVHVDNDLDNAIKYATYKFLREFNESIVSDVLKGDHLLKIVPLLSHLMPRNSKELVIITTNYDCLIEYACSVLGIDVDTLFYGTTIKKFQPSLEKKQHRQIVTNRAKPAIKINHNFVKLLKPHGSLDWHSTPKDEFINISLDSPETVEIITPGISKFQRERREPYNKIYDICNQEIDNARRYLFLGYGFNDQDLQDHYEYAKNKDKPILVITKDLTENIQKLYDEASTIMLIYEDGSGSNIKYKHLETNIEQHDNAKLWDIEVLTEKVLNGKDN
ncbi:hypothetical protein GA840_01365 [Pediococcus ethanolidurans]|uniref:SIR2 family protein n=1 Tax=Pediococcus ethanolidurans TaxID=319653 RepID=UPI002952B3A7|nr:SIR2 family protein [Pediococcus ethanolidurans]MDV7718531.1 hypothetical protein [Pediococcus ethanolidurans]